MVHMVIMFTMLTFSDFKPLLLNLRAVSQDKNTVTNREINKWIEMYRCCSTAVWNTWILNGDLNDVGNGILYSVSHHIK